MMSTAGTWYAISLFFHDAFNVNWASMFKLSCMVHFADGCAVLPLWLFICQVLCRARALSQEEMTMALKRSFERYNMWQGGTSISAMDAMRFQKCIRDAQLVRVARVHTELSICQLVQIVWHYCM